MKKKEIAEMIARLEWRVDALEDAAGLSVQDRTDEEPPPVWQGRPPEVPLDVYLASIPSTELVAHLQKRGVPRRDIDTRKTVMPSVVDGKVVW